MIILFLLYKKIGKIAWNNFKNFNPRIRMEEALDGLA